MSQYGPLVVRPVDTAPMKVVNRVLTSILAAGDDFVLAIQNRTRFDGRGGVLAWLGMTP